MRSKTQANGQRSFIEEARRNQIVETAIRTIATRGFSQASLAEIAREAGISKGVISYHFEGKDELVEAILARLLKEPAEFIKQRVDACATASDKIRAYIRANFAFMRANRTGYVALVDLWGGRLSAKGRHRLEAEAYEPSRHYLARILEDGRAAGEMAPLAEPRTLASVIQAAIDGVALQWVLDAEAVDLDACRDEILAMVAGHIARAPATPARGAAGHDEHHTEE